MTRLTESVVEEAALAWLESAGWQVAHGPGIAPDLTAVEREAFRWGDLGPWDRLGVFVMFGPVGTGQ